MTDTPQSEVPEPEHDDVVEAEVLDDTAPLDLPEDPAEAVPVLINLLMASRAAEMEATDNWKRAAAEFENYRRRSMRDQEELISRSSERVVTQLLPVLDGLDAAMNLDAETETESKMLSGMASMRELLLTTMAREGVEPIATEGAAFDPALHEAVQMGEGEGTLVIAAELRRGYTVHGKVLRASLVAVGYADDSGEEAGESA